MQALEINLPIESDGTIRIPKEYENIYGRNARLVILLPDEDSPNIKTVDLMQYSHTIDWSVDGLEYQKNIREE